MNYQKEFLSVAPMMECTDKHWRRLVREITKKTVLYTEMAVDATVYHQDKFMDFNIGGQIQEHPSVIQLGGCEAEMLGKATEIVTSQGYEYQEVNLNCGCPSPRVSKKSFGARLMLDPELVRQLVSTMCRRSPVPVTVKCRLGADDHDSYDELKTFISTVHSGGVNKFIIHARKCMLNGLTTKQNREIPPLKYDVVHRLVRDFPELEFILNGGVKTLPQAREHLNLFTFNPHAAARNVDGGGGGGRSGVGCSSSAGVGAVEASLSAAASGLCCSDDILASHRDASAEGGDTVFNKVADTAASAVAAADNRYFDDIEELPAVHGVMIGRSAFSNPLMLATADSMFFGEKDTGLSRREILQNYIEYCEEVQSDRGPVRWGGRPGKKQEYRTTTPSLLKPLQNIMNGLPSSNAYRQSMNDAYVRLLNSAGGGASGGGGGGSSSSGSGSGGEADTVGEGKGNTHGVSISSRALVSPRAVIEEAMKCINSDLLDLPINSSRLINCHGRLIEPEGDRRRSGSNCSGSSTCAADI